MGRIKLLDIPYEFYLGEKTYGYYPANMTGPDYLILKTQIREDGRWTIVDREGQEIPEILGREFMQLEASDVKQRRQVRNFGIDMLEGKIPSLRSAAAKYVAAAGNIEGAELRERTTVQGKRRIEEMLSGEGKDKFRRAALERAGQAGETTSPPEAPLVSDAKRVLGG